MKNSTMILLIAAVLCGCNKPDPRIADLEATSKALTNQITELKARTDNLQIQVDSTFAAVTNMYELIKLNAASAAQETPGGSSTEPAASPAATPADDPAPHVVAIARRVTESNSIFWRWAFTFDVGNPGPEALHTKAEVKFLDGDGFEIDSTMVYNVNVPPFATNTFADSEMIQLPGGANVGRIKVSLEN